MRYHFNEGFINTPDYSLDRTVHVLMPSPASGGLTIVITREDLEVDETPAQFVDRQMALAAKQVSKFSKGVPEPQKLGVRAKIDGVRFPVSYKQQGQTLHHVQAIFQLPDTRKMLSFTFTSPAPLTPEHLQIVDAVLGSFELHAK
ncbi:hypothetical protein ASF11_01700 [Acidovorax sp. Leaf76]|uniref:DcrB-related protein n=1 Tax=unclassified Acidovorax TaxID=2684926 RepID=UPI0007023364|nr:MULTISPECIES: DUF1795 domain-containing protein [unclassified Acidovorax]KQO26446.1 hypothetical protein ASF11_01700 [Acidovorax sp. Leaf76]KQO40219.1 hypothetical protein ASF19_00735 [Acidovorax sp. Leaf84]KQS42359.1 hypothetical protein ASG27_00675 [Acidovorax sp. Leaf191]